MLRAILDWIRPPPLQSLADFECLTERSAARLTQKATLVYCRTKAGPNREKLFKEDAFRQALEICRWESYAAVLADFVCVAEGFLRPHAGDKAEAVVRHLGDFYAARLAGQPRPGQPDAGWADKIDETRAMLARAQLADPMPPAEVGFRSGAVIWKTIPIHRDLRRDDREVIVNQTRFALVSFRQELERRADVAAILADLPALVRQAGDDG